MTVAFFDLDRTLLDCNSGQLWLLEAWRAGHLRPRELAFGVWNLGRYAMGADDLDHAIAAVARVYQGYDDVAMTSAIDAWFERAVRHRARPGALAALRAHRDAGDVVVLASSTSHWAADCATRAWGFDHALCTRLEVVDGRVSGRLLASGFGRSKLRLCEAWAAERGLALADTTFYSDSYSDLPLLEKVGRPVVVAPDRRLARVARQRGWSVVDWGSAR